MSQPKAPSTNASQTHTIGEQIAVFRAVYGAADEKRWHDCFHIIFGRGISYADEGAVSIAEQAFTNKLMGMMFNPKAVGALYADQAFEYDMPQSEFAKRAEAIGHIGLDAAERLQAHWGDLPAIHDHEDFWARSLPADWSLTLPSLAGNQEPETMINRDALPTLIERARPTTKADRKTLFQPLDKVPLSTDYADDMGGLPLAVNQQWRRDDRRGHYKGGAYAPPSPTKR